MTRYFITLRKYSWALLACIVVAAIGGFILAKLQPPAYQVTSILVVKAGTAGTQFSTATPPQLSVSQSNDEAIVYSTQIQGRVVMQFVQNFNPKLKQRGYTVDDLLLDVTVTSATSTSPTTSSATGVYASGPFLYITATTSNADDAVLLANSVAAGFSAYQTQQAQTYLTNTRTSVEGQIKSLQDQSAKLEQQILAITSASDPRAQQYNVDRASINNQIDRLQAQLVNIPPSVVGDVFVSQSADPSLVTSAGKSPLIIGGAVGVGALIGILVLLLLVFLDNGLYQIEQVKEKLGLAYLGVVANAKEGGTSLMNPGGPEQGQLSDIRTNLRLAGVLSGEMRAPSGSILLVTSARAAEGKTTIAAALAASTARNGGTVVVVDGNLRQPGTHLAFGGSGTDMGLSGLLRSGREVVDDIVQRTNLPNIWLVSAGQGMDDPTLLLQQKLPNILNQLRKKADLTIIDGPALLSNADASLLATMVDGTMLVVDIRHTKMPMLLRAKELLTGLTKRASGVVMNRMPAVTAKRAKENYFTIPFVPAPSAKAESGSVNGTGMLAASGANNGANGYGNGNGNGSWSPEFMPVAPMSVPPPSPRPVASPLPPMRNMVPDHSSMAGDMNIPTQQGSMFGLPPRRGDNAPMSSPMPMPPSKP